MHENDDTDLNADFDYDARLARQQAPTPQFPINVNMREHKFSVADLCDQIAEGLIELNPHFQRDSVWGRQKSELIESILMGIPIPPIYAYQTNSGRFDIIDGKQRLACVSDFYNNKFKLNDLENLSSLNGKNFEGLEQKYQAQIKRYQFNFYVILSDTDERIKYDIFKRVNRGGVNLNNQEMRNALYHGKATDLIDEMSKILSFKRATGFDTKKDIRMKDRYLTLRFVAFYLFINHHTTIDTINGIDNFLRDIMKDINNDKIKFDFKTLKANFKKAMDFIEQHYDDSLFRFVPKKEGQRIRKLNIPLFESLTFAFVSALEKGFDFPNKESIDKFKKILDEPRYITFGIDSNENVKFRFDLAKKLIKEELDA